MQISMEKYGAFWFFMCCTLLGIVFVYFLLPETKGKTLEDIEKLFSKKYNADGTLKTPEVQPDNYSDGKTASIGSTGIQMKPSRSSLRQQKDGQNGGAALENGNGITTLAINPIVDSEDEDEEDESLVAAPGGH
jgi:hypothetical protein